jgi:S1-C subfamily serine protease
MTGFKTNENFLVTDEYFFKSFKKASEVEISFYNSDANTVKASKRISVGELNSRIIRDIDSKTASFAAINIDFEEFKNIPSLKISTEKSIEIGQPIATLGFQLDKSNLCVKSGIVSSLFESENGLKYAQVDSSIKQGNSGSPLINAETCEVVGIIGHKLATITQSHKRMKQIINNNLAILKKSQGIFNVEEIDPIQVLIANQNQIKHITNEIYKTATMSIGYALDISYVHDLFEEFIDAEVSQTSLKFQIDA